MKVLAATNNAGKLKELRRILERMDHTVVSPKELGLTPGPGRDRRHLCRKRPHQGGSLLPGVRPAHRGRRLRPVRGGAGRRAPAFTAPATAAATATTRPTTASCWKPWPTCRKGRAAQSLSRRCACCCPAGPCHIFLGECPGRIGFAEQGTNGFGYDPLFIPDRVGLPDGSTAPNAQGRSYAQLADGEKDAISHRGRAMAAMAEALPQFWPGHKAVSTTFATL